jgi:hypothetical protein
MVATDEELLNAFHGNCIGGAPRLCAVYNLGRQHAAQPRQKQQPLPPPAPVTANPAAIGRFGEWLAREMPPGTEIGQPLHWAPRIVFAVLNACQEVEPTPPPAPAGDPVAVPSGLVERVLSQLPSGTDPVFARHAILETADWADEEGYIATARVLQEVAIRSITHPTPPPALAGGLVEKLAIVWSDGRPLHPVACRDALLLVANWLDTKGHRGSAAELRQEVDQGRADG